MDAALLRDPDRDFSAEVDAIKLRQAMEGLGTDEREVIDVVCCRDSDQCHQIIRAYSEKYNRDLISDLKSELSGDFGKAVAACMTPTTVLLAQEVRRVLKGAGSAIKLWGAGTYEKTLVEILCTLSNAELTQLKQIYGEKLLRDEIKGNTSGDFQKLVLTLATGYRDEDYITPATPSQLADRLYEAGEGGDGRDERVFIDILTRYSLVVLRETFKEYLKKGKSLADAIRAEFSGVFADGLLAVMSSIENKPAFFAERLYHAMKGLGTRDDDLIRIMVTRTHLDIEDIKREYESAYGKPLAAAIKSDTSGDYRTILLALCSE